jgi:hypothetical protein
MRLRKELEAGKIGPIEAGTHHVIREGKYGQVASSDIEK